MKLETKAVKSDKPLSDDQLKANARGGWILKSVVVEGGKYTYNYVRSVLD